MAKGPYGRRPTRRELFQYAGRRHFWWFFLWAFGAKDYCLANPQDNWVSEDVHKPLCDWIERHVKDWEATRRSGTRQPKKLMVEMFRGGGKSTIGCALDLWLQLRDPELSEIISSFDEPKSKEFLAVDRAFLEGTNAFGYFRQLYGVWSPPGDERSWQKDALTHMRRMNPSLRDYSIRVTSVSKGMTGSRPDVLRLDDPIVREKLTTEANWIGKAKEHLDASKYAVKSSGLTIVLLTPYAELDVAGKIMREEGIASISGATGFLKPERDYTRGGEWHVYYLPVRDEAGRSVLPQVYPDPILWRMEQDDPDDFAAQMMCNPTGGLNNPLPPPEIDKLVIPPDRIPKNLEISIHCDTAFKDATSVGRGDFNTIQKWGHDRETGKVYYLDGWRSREWTARDFYGQLGSLLKSLYLDSSQPFVVTSDRPVGGTRGTFEMDLTGVCRDQGIPCPPVLELGRGRVTKETRIRSAALYWRTGKVWLSAGAGALSELKYEMGHIGWTAHDDMADAAADAFHPDVYTPAQRDISKFDQIPTERPYDTLLWTRPGAWTDNETRLVYDELEDRRTDYEWIED